MTSRVLLYWLPLGAGRTTGCVRTNGRVYERIVAAREAGRPATSTTRRWPSGGTASAPSSR